MATTLPLVQRKSPDEVARMQEAGRVLAACLEHLAAQVVPGITTAGLDALAEGFIRDHGCVPGFLGYHGYPASLCVSVNEQVVHGIPGRLVIREGDLVGLDCGLVRDGWWADSGLSVVAGEGDEESARLVAVAAQALERGIDAAKAGNHVGDIGRAVQSCVEAAGFSVVRAYVGHGIGRAMHEPPPVPNAGRPGEGPELRPGMVLAIEPMVNAGGPEVREEPDGWTVVTVDGRRSAYAEHTVAVTEEGPLVLTRRTTELAGELRDAARALPGGR